MQKSNQSRFRLELADTKKEILKKSILICVTNQEMLKKLYH